MCTWEDEAKGQRWNNSTENHNSPYWYAQIRLADGSLSNNKSTGKESRTEAEKVVMEWVVKVECPKRVLKKGNSKNSNSLDTLAMSYK